MIDVVLDLSHWQAVTSFSTIKSSGISAVILKASQGTSWIDSTYVGRYAAATASGLLVGAYHFMDASDPISQVANFWTVANHVQFLAVDIEPNGMGNTATVSQAAEFVARLYSMTSRLPVVYIGRYGPDGNGIGLPNSVLNRCPLWLPEYGTRPICPEGWDSYTLWQYTETGQVDGVIGNVDRSRFNGDETQLAALFGAT